MLCVCDDQVADAIINQPFGRFAAIVRHCLYSTHEPLGGAPYLENDTALCAGVYTMRAVQCHEMICVVEHPAA
jgi:hypothetical protein